jgi:hypothetical protein
LTGDFGVKDHLPEFETFPLAPRRGVDINKFEFLKNMPLNAHVHFTDDPKILRTVVSVFNDQAKREGSNFHLSLRRVGESDPKGVGFRIVRDDKRVERSAGKPRLVAAAKSWNPRLPGRERG